MEFPSQRMVDKITEWNLSEQPNMEQYRVHLLEAADNALAKLQSARPKDLRVLNLRIQVLPGLVQDYGSMGRLNDALTSSELSVVIADELVKYTNDGALPDPGKGLVHARIAEQLQPENPRSWSLIAQGHEMLGDKAEEARNYEKSQEIDPLHSYGLNWLVTPGVPVSNETRSDEQKASGEGK